MPEPSPRSPQSTKNHSGSFPVTKIEESPLSPGAPPFEGSSLLWGLAHISCADCRGVSPRLVSIRPGLCSQGPGRGQLPLVQCPGTGPLLRGLHPRPDLGQWVEGQPPGEEVRERAEDSGKAGDSKAVFHSLRQQPNSATQLGTLFRRRSDQSWSVWKAPDAATGSPCPGLFQAFP